MQLLRADPCVEKDVPREVHHHQRGGQEHADEGRPALPEGKAASLAWRLHADEGEEAGEEGEVQPKHQRVCETPGSLRVQVLESWTEGRREYRGPTSGANHRGDGERRNAGGAAEGSRQGLAWHLCLCLPPSAQRAATGALLTHSVLSAGGCDGISIGLLRVVEEKQLPIHVATRWFRFLGK